ncbi:hypothetical protein KM043_011881 [Ampulex compressa]|nr:hypothetical protein KM043_011881 [Ampulex compressa]
MRGQRSLEKFESKYFKGIENEEFSSAHLANEEELGSRIVNESRGKFGQVNKERHARRSKSRPRNWRNCQTRGSALMGHEGTQGKCSRSMALNRRVGSSFARELVKITAASEILPRGRETRTPYSSPRNSLLLFERKERDDLDPGHTTKRANTLDGKRQLNGPVVFRFELVQKCLLKFGKS